MAQVLSQLHNIVRYLSAAGYAKALSGQEKYFLYVDAEESSLQCQRWSSDNAFIKEELVAESVRPNSTAAYIVTPINKYIVCITPSSTLSICTYDDEEREWVETDATDRSIPTYNVHRLGRLAASVDASGQLHLVFQDASQGLTYVDNSWSGKALHSTPIVGSPLFISVDGSTPHVFYISSKDGFIHDISGASGNWTDTVVLKHRFDNGIKNFAVEENEVFVLTKDDVLQKVNAQGRLTKLGRMQNGKFVSERSVDSCVNDAWNGVLTEDRLKEYLADDPECMDTQGGDQSVTPLAAACMTARLDVLRLLLRLGANPNALSCKRRTPLFLATSTKQNRDRHAIVRTLLEAGANVDECYAESGFATPLMNAITLISDDDVVKILLDHGASPNAKDVTGQTAEMLAKGTSMGDVLSERAEEAKSSPFEKQIIEFIIALLMFIITYTNNQRVKDFVDQIARQLVGMNDDQGKNTELSGNSVGRSTESEKR